MKNNTIIIALVALLPLIASCKWVNKSIDDTLHGRPATDTGDRYMTPAGNRSNNFLSNTKDLANAEKALRNIPELKGKKLVCFDDLQVFDDGRVMIKLQDPDTVANINEYDFNGQEWGPKKPVPLTNADTMGLTHKYFALDTMPFTRVATLALLYFKKALEKGSTSKPDHIYYIADAGQWYGGDIQAGRTTYQIYFYPNGTLKEFSKE